MKKLLLVGVAAWLAGGSALAQGASVQREIATTHAHARMAATADTVEIGHAHLHHVVNCLVGPGGKGFDAAEVNPCKGMGNGAIPDARGNASLQAALKRALASAEAGLAASDLATIHRDGHKVVAELESKTAARPGS